MGLDLIVILICPLMVFTYIMVSWNFIIVKDKIKRIEFEIGLILEHLEIDRFPEHLKEMALAPSPQIRLKAVRLYVKETGATLKEAIEAVENLSGRKFKS